MNLQTYSNSLFIGNRGKVIPYKGSKIKRKDGNINSGFKNLKVRPELIDNIPELTTDSALKSLVRLLNAKEMNFFSVGCFSSLFSEEGYTYRGYIEFAFNCRICVRDARNYFSLYFHFEQFLRKNNFEQKVDFNWMLEEVEFSDVSIDGFSCAIFIRTNYCESNDIAYDTWKKSLKILESFLASVQVKSHSLIY